MSWKCSVCNFGNDRLDVKCEMCDALISTQTDTPIETLSSPPVVTIEAIYSSENIQYEQENQSVNLKLMSITSEYDSYKAMMSSKLTAQNEQINELQTMCNKLQSKNDKLERRQNNNYDESKRLKAQLMQLQIMVNVLQNENNNLKQQNISQNECKDKFIKLQKEKDENKKLQFQLQNVIDHHNEYKELMEGESREKDKLIQFLQENNNDELIGQYSKQLNQFQTMMIDIRDKNRKLKIENDSMKRMLSEHNLHLESRHLKQRAMTVSSPNILSNVLEPEGNKSQKKTESMMNRLKNVFTNNNNTNDANTVTNKE